MDIVLRATAMFAIAFVLIRLLGKRELAQMTPFEALLLIVIGDLIQQGVTHNDYSLTGATLAIFTFAFWGLVLGWLVYLFPRLKAPLEGSPRIIVRDGALLEDNLRRDRVTRAEVESEMRLAGIAHLREVAWAIIEPQGKISFIRREGGGKTDGRTDEDGPAP